MLARRDILSALRDVLDPEMPINIVDLGLVERIELRPAGPPAPCGAGSEALRRPPAAASEPTPRGVGASGDEHSARAPSESTPQGVGASGDERSAHAASEPTPPGVGPSPDVAPQVVHIDLLPTFVGCPALPLLETLVRQRVAALPGVAAVEVRFIYAPPWSVERISPAGREALRRHGVAVPQRGAAAAQPAPVALTVSGRTASPAAPPAADVVACPYCGSEQTTLESRFGPTRCRSIYYCGACKNSFEQMKPI